MKQMKMNVPCSYIKDSPWHARVNHTAVFLNIQKVGDNEIQMYSKYMALDERHIDKYCCLFIYKLKYYINM